MPINQNIPIWRKEKRRCVVSSYRNIFCGIILQCSLPKNLAHQDSPNIVPEFMEIDYIFAHILKNITLLRTCAFFFTKTMSILDF